MMNVSNNVTDGARLYTPDPNHIPSIEANQIIDDRKHVPECDNILDKKLKAMQAKLLVDTVTVFNRKVQDYFFGDDFDDKMKSIATDWFTVMNSSSQLDASQMDSSQHNVSILDKSMCIKEPLEPRITALENRLNSVTNKLDTLVEELEKKTMQTRETRGRNY